MTNTSQHNPNGRFYPLLDARCTHRTCTGNASVYRTVGHCTNCSAGPLLVLVTAAHPFPTERKCPKCGCYQVRADRLAEEDELPDPPAVAAAPGTSDSGEQDA